MQRQGVGGCNGSFQIFETCEYTVEGEFVADCATAYVRGTADRPSTTCPSDVCTLTLAEPGETDCAAFASTAPTVCAAVAARETGTDCEEWARTAGIHLGLGQLAANALVPRQGSQTFQESCAAAGGGSAATRAPGRTTGSPAKPPEAGRGRRQRPYSQ